MRIALVTVLAFTAHASAAVIRVGPNESVKRVTDGLKRAKAGDTVEIMTGRYSEGPLVISHGGQKGRPITVRAGKGQKPVIAGPINDPKINQVIYFWKPPEKDIGWWVFEDIEFEGGHTYCIKVDHSHMVFRRCKFHGSGRDCIKSVNGANDLLFDECEIYDSGKRDPSNAEGIDMMAGDGLVVRNCHIHDTPTCGVYVKGAGKNALFEGNLVERTGHQALCLGQSSGIKFLKGQKYESFNGIMRNNVIYNCQGGGLMISSSIGSKVYNNTLIEPATKSGGGIYIVNSSPTRAANKDFEIRNNIVYSSSKRWFVVLGKAATDPTGKRVIDNNLYFHPGGKGQVKVMCEDQSVYKGNFYGPFSTYQSWGFDKNSRILDPKVVNPSGGNFQLAAGSPGIDRGVSIENFLKDRAGLSRVVGKAIDLGAYEFGAESAVTAEAEKPKSGKKIWPNPKTPPTASTSPSWESANAELLTPGKKLLADRNFAAAAAAYKKIESKVRGDGAAGGLKVLAATAEAGARLKQAIVKRAGRGKPMHLYVPFGGRKARAKVTGASDESVSVNVLGQPTEVPWSDISDAGLYRLAKPCAGADESLRLDLVRFAAGRKMAEKLADALAHCAELSAEAGAKARALAKSP